MITPLLFVLTEKMAGASVLNDSLNKASLDPLVYVLRTLKTKTKWKWLFRKSGNVEA